MKEEGRYWWFLKNKSILVEKFPSVQDNKRNISRKLNLLF